MLLTKGNKKLGEDVFIFNLPVFLTCPGATPACKLVCYADRGHCRWPMHRQRYRQNYLASHAADFPEQVIAELDRRNARLCRPHSSGDFYGGEYVLKWVRIASALPQVKFWAYTRSWRIPTILTALETLASLPNFNLWFSADQDSGLPPIVPGVRTAWLQIEEELPPDTVDLIFRTKHKGRQVTKRIGLALVCPAYNGLNDDGVTCSQCKVCF